LHHSNFSSTEGKESKHPTQPVVLNIAVFAQGKGLEHNPWNCGFIENLELATSSAVFTVSQPTITRGF
jgi:hypothetical protein